MAQGPTAPAISFGQSFLGEAQGSKALLEPLEPRFLASKGFVVMACDHPGSARYTQVSGRVIKPGGSRSVREQMEADRPKDLMVLLDAMSKMAMGQEAGTKG